jgi:pyruvate/2-oxoacid:ferredoxin oxidoreductase beta subunit
MITSRYPDYPSEELMHSGHLACQGCGGSMIMRHVLKALGPDTIVVIPACCWTIIAGNFPYSSLKTPILHTLFETAAVAASGVKAALEVQGNFDTKVLAFAGDGGTFDIGLQSLSGAAERNDDIIYVCYDNEAYMNTGIQRSSATPIKAWTTTTPVDDSKAENKKNIVEIMAAHRIPYVATANAAYPTDLVEKVKRAASFKGTKFLHIMSPCPPGWKISSEMSIEVARLATETNIFPLYEIFNGERYQITFEPKKTKPVLDYLSMQGRFRHITTEDVELIQKRADFDWKMLNHKCTMEVFEG